jgi:hypothetical protein
MTKKPLAWYRYIVVVGLDEEQLAYVAEMQAGTDAKSRVSNEDALGYFITTGISASLTGGHHDAYVEAVRVDSLEPLVPKTAAVAAVAAGGEGQ